MTNITSRYSFLIIISTDKWIMLSETPSNDFEGHCTFLSGMQKHFIDCLIYAYNIYIIKTIMIISMWKLKQKEVNWLPIDNDNSLKRAIKKNSYELVPSIRPFSFTKQSLGLFWADIHFVLLIKPLIRIPHSKRIRKKKYRSFLDIKL